MLLGNDIYGNVFLTAQNVAGHTADYVNLVLQKVAKGDRTGGVTVDDWTSRSLAQLHTLDVLDLFNFVPAVLMASFSSLAFPKRICAANLRHVCSWWRSAFPGRWLLFRHSWLLSRTLVPFHAVTAYSVRRWYHFCRSCPAHSDIGNLSATNQTPWHPSVIAACSAGQCCHFCCNSLLGQVLVPFHHCCLDTGVLSSADCSVVFAIQRKLSCRYISERANNLLVVCKD